ncbi:MAG: VOC family protein [Acidobacteria bacterium]|nr:VOC family protein [Acidobacteriota bacterium]
MKIEHLAIWVENLEATREFYEKYFGAAAGPKYVNAAKRFESYFLSFGDGCRLELMHRPGLGPSAGNHENPAAGIAHFAVAAGSREAVDALTERLRRDGFRIVGEPRTTGDGYYESVVLDPAGNLVEITV